MHEVELDASSWKTAQDFRLALKAAIGAPDWHGHIVGAFLDSIFGGGMNALKPPYAIKVVNTENLSPEVRGIVRDFSSAIAETRERRLARTGEDVAVRLEIES
ncbi:barstar family protein [Bradyrhizobium sp. 14AA]